MLAAFSVAPSGGPGDDSVPDAVAVTGAIVDTLAVHERSLSGLVAAIRQPFRRPRRNTSGNA